jgi:hypothetical protein
MQAGRLTRGLMRQSYRIARCSPGMRRCVPSPVDVGLTPVKRSNMTARKPPGTSYSAESTTAAPSARGTA